MHWLALLRSGTFLGLSTLAGVLLAFAVDAFQLPITSPLFPAYSLARTADGAGPTAFDIREAPDPSPIPTPEPSQLAVALAKAEVLGTDGRGAPINGSGFPRVPLVSQFDGGPFQGANCTLAAGAMLAHLGFGIRTTGSVLRDYQSDDVGGTDLGDLAEAMRNAYGKTIARGPITQGQLRALVQQGYGVVLQGKYDRVLSPYSLQPRFSGGHAIYVDGYWEASSGGAWYFVI
jgi:hypothetical protein